jgi:hypothetical protein
MFIDVGVAGSTGQNKKRTAAAELFVRYLLPSDEFR